jgi:hypothetical protein
LSKKYLVRLVRVEAQGLDVSLRPLARLAQNEELGRAAVKRLPRKIEAGEVLGLSQAY